jgi:hypothetical protein
MKTLPSEHNSAAMHSFFGVNAAGVRIRVPAGLRLITDEMPGQNVRLGPDVLAEHIEIPRDYPKEALAWWPGARGDVSPAVLTQADYAPIRKEKSYAPRVY